MGKVMENMIKFILDFFMRLFKKEEEKVLIVPVEVKKDIETYDNGWKVFKSISPDNTDSNVLEALYRDELGTRHTFFCMAIFESSSQFKLVAPWLGSGRILIKGNVTEFGAKEIPKKIDQDYTSD